MWHLRTSLLIVSRDPAGREAVVTGLQAIWGSKLERLFAYEDTYDGQRLFCGVLGVATTAPRPSLDLIETGRGDQDPTGPAARQPPGGPPD